MDNLIQSHVSENLGDCRVVVEATAPYLRFSGDEAMALGKQLIEQGAVAAYVNLTHAAIRDMAAQTVLGAPRDQVTRTLAGGEIVDFVAPMRVAELIPAEPVPGAGTPPPNTPTPVAEVLTQDAHIEQNLDTLYQKPLDGDYTPPEAFSDAYRLGHAIPQIGEGQSIEPGEVGTVEGLGILP